MKDKIKILFIICVMFFSITSSTYVQANDNQQEKTPVKVRQTLSVATILDDPEFDEVIDLYIGAGWIYNKEQIQLERLIDVQENEHIKFLEETIGNKNVVKISEEMSSLNIEQSSRVDINNEVMIYELPIDGMFDDGEEKIPKLEYAPMASTTNPYWKDGERGVTGYLVHCNRFNGHLGNNRYYSGKLKAQTHKNFLFSDCDYGFVASGFKCVKDYIPGVSNYCAAYPASKQATCSKDIGHSRKFHFH